MKIILISSLFIVLLLIVLQKFSPLSNDKKIKVCSEAGFIPFEMKTANGEWDGYEIALLSSFMKDSGKSMELFDLKFDGLIPALIAGKGCDIIVSAVGITSEREKVAIFSDPTYQSAYAGIVRVSDKNKLNSFDKIKAQGIRIAVQQGTEAASYVATNFKNALILSYEDNSMPINAIITNKADIYIDDSVYATIIVKKNMQNLLLVKPEILPKNIYGGMGFVFRKSDVKLRDEFNLFLHKIKQNGELAKLQRYYFEDMLWN